MCHHPMDLIAMTVGYHLIKSMDPTYTKLEMVRDTMYHGLPWLRSELPHMLSVVRDCAKAGVKFEIRDTGIILHTLN